MGEEETTKPALESEAKPPQASEESKSPTGGRWAKVKHWCWKYIGTLFMDSKNGGQAMSLGRVSFLLVLCLALWMWSPLGGSLEIPETMSTALLTLMGYNLGSKGVHTVKEIFGKTKG